MKNNFVAKWANKFNKAKVFKSKKDYSRKTKHKSKHSIKNFKEEEE